MKNIKQQIPPIWEATFINWRQWGKNALFLIAQGFKKQQLQQGASSLTYYSLLALVPVLTLFFAMTKGFLIQEDFQHWLTAKLVGQETMINILNNLAQHTLRISDKGLLLISVVIALWSGMQILGSVELAMNQIWEVRQGRSFAKCFSDYLALLCLCPLVVIFSSTLTFILSAAVTDLNHNFHLDKELYILFNIIPIVLNWFFFTFLFIFIPNTRVRFIPALWAGILSGTLYQFMLWFYFYSQVNVSSYNTLYGTLAALPLFLIWVQLSWMIVLMGAKMAYAFQNAANYIVSDVHIALSHTTFLLLGLRITHLCIHNFYATSKPTSLHVISETLSLSLPLTHRIVVHLVSTGLLAEIANETSSFQPALPVENLTIKQVIDALESSGAVAKIKDKSFMKLEKHLIQFSELIENSKDNILLKDI